MSWWGRFRALGQAGILGMNCRNSRLNPRSRFPLVDSKRQMHDLCRTIGVPTPEIYGAVGTHSALRQLPRLLADRTDFAIKPNRGAAGRGILVVTAPHLGNLFGAQAETLHRYGSFHRPAAVKPADLGLNGRSPPTAISITTGIHDPCWVDRHAIEPGAVLVQPGSRKISTVSPVLTRAIAARSAEIIWSG